MKIVWFINITQGHHFTSQITTQKFHLFSPSFPIFSSNNQPSYTHHQVPFRPFFIYSKVQEVQQRSLVRPEVEGPLSFSFIHHFSTLELS
ncbi:hypothetical protein HanRHA438_Chr15g0711651 [Helianthus annuus]|nr:hypothetical protein HanRHA438_Chr15g0711651 [Helianthus annuus]